MRIVQPVIAVALATAGLTACSSTPTTRQLAQDAVELVGSLVQPARLNAAPKVVSPVTHREGLDMVSPQCGSIR